MSHLNTLKERQDYYQYDSRPWRMKEPPTLNPELRQAMKRKQLDRGYRFVWGGVVIVREEPNSESFVIARGERNACTVFNGVFMPKYSFGRAQQARGYAYTNALGQKVSGFTREEFVPKEYLARVDYRYVDFGKLFWYLETRQDAEQLIAASVYDKKQAVPESEWICIKALEAKNGLYYEPGLEMIEILEKREWQNLNADLKQVAADMMQRTAKARLEYEQAQDAAGKKEFDLMFNDVIKKVEKQTVYSMPTRPTVTMDGAGRIVKAVREIKQF